MIPHRSLETMAAPGFRGLVAKCVESLFNVSPLLRAPCSDSVSRYDVQESGGVSHARRLGGSQHSFTRRHRGFVTHHGSRRKQD